MASNKSSYLLHNVFQIAMVIGAIAAVLLIAAAYPVFKYHECRKVGHGKFYCVMEMGK